MMKNTSLILLLLCLIGLGSCSSKIGKMDSPRSTFETIKHAILNRDIEAYTACWHPERLEREGMISKLKSNPDKWDELAGYFKGKVSVTETDIFERDGKKMCKLQMEAPDADGGGLGGMSMIKVDGKWLLWGW